MKEGSKFTITANGEQSVMIAGTSTMLVVVCRQLGF